MRALVVSNMRPDSGHPARGSFVRDQVDALARIDGLEVELLEERPGAGGYARLARALATRRGRGYDVVHAHFGLTAWPTLALRGPKHAVTLHGTDVRHPRSGRLTRAVLPFMDLVAVASQALADELASGGGRGGAGAAARRGDPRDVAILPAGIAMDRLRPIPREEARTRLGRDPRTPLLLFPADPLRAVKRADRARELAADAGVELVTLGATPPHEMPLWINAANAVLVPSEAEGFGLAAVEALACDVPVLATPVGIHPEALAGIDGTLCAPYERAAWGAALAPLLAADAPRVAGRERAARWGADAMAARVVAAWRELTAPSGTPGRSKV
jgi:teichuronic acid biosynthesis glycosyltransferase TuaC